MREVPKSGPLVLKGGSADPDDPPLATGLSPVCFITQVCSAI